MTSEPIGVRTPKRCLVDLGADLPDLGVRLARAVRGRRSRGRTSGSLSPRRVERESIQLRLGRQLVPVDNVLRSDLIAGHNGGVEGILAVSHEPHPRVHFRRCDRGSAAQWLEAAAPFHQLASSALRQQLTRNQQPAGSQPGTASGCESGSDWSRARTGIVASRALVAVCIVFCTVAGMAIFADMHPERTLSVTAATGRGVA
ncbi:MAG: hypothetical protein QG597_2674, partial [Actinomycetota bacterium]|nr:hypothetical protein [Actinomycetota bacterium]